MVFKKRRKGIKGGKTRRWIDCGSCGSKMDQTLGRKDASKGTKRRCRPTVLLVKHMRRKGHLNWINVLKKDPKKGTGKNQKALQEDYIHENPKDTVPVKFRTAKDVRETFSSSSFKSKPHKRQSQIINLVEQRRELQQKEQKTPKQKRQMQHIR